MRADLYDIIAASPDTFTAYEIITRVNRACGVGPLQWPKPSNTYCWTEIFQAITLAGFKPTYAVGPGDDGPSTLLHIFSRQPKEVKPCK